MQAGVEGIIKRAPSPSVAGKASELDAVGTDLWNGTTNLLRDADDNGVDPYVKRDAPTRSNVLLRVFAFQLLDAAYRASSKRAKDAEQRVRNFKLALKACRLCLESDELELAMNVLERCSDHVSAVEDASPLVRLTTDDGDNDRGAKMKLLAAEFYLLRVMHAWKSGRLDVANHFTTKISVQAISCTGLPEKAADLFYEVGKSLLKQPDIIAATEWLERASTMLDACEVENLSDDAADLRLSISAKLGKTASPWPELQ